MSGVEKPEGLETVEVWLGTLDFSQEAISRWGGVLNGEEWARARRFRLEEDRRGFISGRGMVKELLGRRLGIGAGAVKIGYGPWGKPWIDGVEFSVSHAGGRLAVALGRVAVGIDLERVRGGLDLVGMARAAFGAEGAEEIARAAGKAQEELFFERWVAREAVGKLSGRGMQEEPRLAEFLYRLELGEGWKGALASAEAVRVVMYDMESHGITRWAGK